MPWPLAPRLSVLYNNVNHVNNRRTESMDENRNFKLKAALLSTCLVSASLNAVTGLVPEMAAAFPDLALSTIELVATVPSSATRARCCSR